MDLKVEKEYENGVFGDRPLGKRLVKMGTNLARKPSSSFPRSMRTVSDLEGTYRFLRHPEVSPDKILAPHIEATRLRCEGYEVIVAHDTMHFCFSTPRADLRNGRTFFGHVALAVTKKREALGVVGTFPYVRTKSPTRKKTRHTERQPESQRESSR